MKITKFRLPSKVAIEKWLSGLPNDEVYTPVDVCKLTGVPTGSIRRLLMGNHSKNIMHVGRVLYCGTEKAILTLRRRYKISNDPHA